MSFVIGPMTRPGDLAREYLPRAVIERIRDWDGGVFTAHPRAWKILDRWAQNDPEKLAALVAGDVPAMRRLGMAVEDDIDARLETRLMRQEIRERDALARYPNPQLLHRNNMAEHEILDKDGVRQGL